MRSRVTVWVVIAFGALASWSGRVVAAQELVVATGRPRFLYAASKGATPVEIDASRSAVLRRAVSLQIEAPTVGRLLAEIERQTGLTFVHDGNLRTDRPLAVRAESIPVASALAAILHDAGVDVVLSPGGHVALVRTKRAATNAQAAAVAGRVTDSKTGNALSGVDVSLEGTRWRGATDADGRYRLADVSPGGYTVLARRIGYGPVRRVVTVSGQEVTVDVTLEPAATRLGEVVVTAQKRGEERLQDVPIPVTAVAADRLLEGNQLRLQDYYTSVPGLSLTSGGGGDKQLSIRGIATGGATNPTVGITIDDVPFGSTAGYTAAPPPDIDPGELARVEVLRGPQGTLYGASSVGGLLKFVTVDPSTDRASGRLQTGTSSVYDGDKLGYSVHGAINVPLGRTLAVRGSAFTRRDPGYVDGLYVNDPTFRVRDINEADVHGGRLAALWRPSDVWSLKLGALVQNVDATGRSGVTLQPGLGDLQQTVLLRGRDGGYRHQMNSYTATLAIALGDISLTAISGYSVNEYSTTGIFPPYSGGTSALFPGASAQAIQSIATNKFTQEMRVSGPLTPWLGWRVGGFYTHEDSPKYFGAFAIDPNTLLVHGLVMDDPYPTSYREYAAFGDLTFNVTDRFDVQIGGRLSQNTQTYEETVSGPLWEYFGFESPSINPTVHTKDNSFTYLLTPRFKVSPNVMTYVRLASGYRPGGPNPTCALFNIPCQYGPDKTLNYELGVKGDAFDHVLSFDASVYYIDWRDIQLTLRDLATLAGYYTNGGKAKSQGVELSVQVRPREGLTLAGWVAWNDAVLTEDFPPTSTAFGSAGDRLPYSSRISSNVSVDQDFSLASSVTGFVGGSASSVDDRAGGFRAGSQARQPIFPGYTQVDLRAGARKESWTVNAFVTNVTDARGILSGDPEIHAGINYIRPRTAGLSLAKTF